MLRQSFTLEADSRDLRITTPLLGPHQATNAAVAYAVLQVLATCGFSVDDHQFVQSIAAVTCPGRIQIVAARPWLVLDCAHNRVSAAALAATLPRHLSYDKLVSVLGVSADKDGEGIIAELGEILCGLVPAALQIATIAVDNWDSAAEHARALATLCRRIGETASNPRPWTIVAELLKRPYDEESRYDELTARAHDLVEEQEQLLAIVAYLGATLQAGVTPVKAAYGHLSIVPYIETMLRNTPAYTYIVVPFLVQYWERTIDQAAFRFRQPRHVKHRLAEAQGQSVARLAPEQQCFGSGCLSSRPHAWLYRRDRQSLWMAGAGACPL